VHLRIEGLPKPQGSKRVFNGRVVEASGNALKVWRRAIADECQAQVTENHKLILGPVEVTCVFYLPRPKTVKESDRPLPIVPPDIDKLARGLLDGIGQSGMVWGDDSQVIELKAIKVYGTDFIGAEVKITEL
jgi:Holliday junction resolvase RusA-like endonuclease